MADRTETDETEDGRADSVDPIVREGLRRFAYCAEAEGAQRQAILLAKKFRSGDQWDEQVKVQRQGGPAIQGQAAQPSRPCLTIDRVSAPVRQISNSIKQANIAASVLPNGAGSSQEVAEILRDWMRRVQNDAREQAPIEWAADQAAEGGIGWFRLRTDYNEAVTETADGDALFDQDAMLERIQNNLSVYADPSCKLPTKRDARFMFVTEDLPRSEFKRLYDTAKLALWDDFRAVGDGEGWTTETTVRVAEYWHVEYDDVRIVQTQDGTVYKGDDIPKDLPKDRIKHDRIFRAPKIMCDKINALEVLGSYEWIGSRIPLFPILGEELNVDGKPIVRGVIQPAIDPQRMTNYTYSAAIETAALEPKSPWIVNAASVANYKALWQNANTANYSYLPWDESGEMGQKNTPPFRVPPGSNIGSFVELMVRSEEAVKATTGIFDPSLGNTNPREKSGKAIEALQSQSEHGTSNYLDNTKNAVLDLAREMVCIAPKILDRPGRVLSVLGIDDQPSHVMLGQPFTKGKDGQPQPVMTEDGQPVSPEEAARINDGVTKFYDISKGRYSVTVSTSKSYPTRRQEGADAMGALIPNLPPPMAAAITPTFIRSLDFPDANKVADIAQKTLPPELQAGAEGEAPIPPQAQAAIAQLQQQLQQAAQEIQEAKSGIAAKQIDAQASLQKAQIDAESRVMIEREKIASSERIAALENQTKLLIAGQNVDVQRAKVIAETDRTLMEHAAQAVHQDKEHEHAETLAAMTPPEAPES